MPAVLGQQAWVLQLEQAWLPVDQQHAWLAAVRQTLLQKAVSGQAAWTASSHPFTFGDNAR